MILIRQHENPAEYAPTIFFHHCGAMPWSGRHASAFTCLELVELLAFCEEEGYRQGLNEADQDRIETRRDAPFHQDFMGGFPKKIWENAYWQGIHELGNSSPEAIALEVQKVLNEPSTSHWLRDALTRAVLRDPVDALNDAEYLSDVLARRTNATGQH
jgi:hypothetical protein